MEGEGEATILWKRAVSNCLVTSGFCASSNNGLSQVTCDGGQLWATLWVPRDPSNCPHSSGENQPLVGIYGPFSKIEISTWQQTFKQIVSKFHKQHCPCPVDIVHSSGWSGKEQYIQSEFLKIFWQKFPTHLSFLVGWSPSWTDGLWIHNPSISSGLDSEI